MKFRPSRKDILDHYSLDEILELVKRKGEMAKDECMYEMTGDAPSHAEWGDRGDAYERDHGAAVKPSVLGTVNYRTIDTGEGLFEITAKWFPHDPSEDGAPEMFNRYGFEPLCCHIMDVLPEDGMMCAGEIIEAVEENGYRTNTDDIEMLVHAALWELINKGMVEKIRAGFFRRIS